MLVSRLFLRWNYTEAVMLGRDLETPKKPIMAQNRSYGRSVWVYNWDVLNLNGQKNNPKTSNQISPKTVVNCQYVTIIKITGAAVRYHRDEPQ